MIYLGADHAGFSLKEEIRDYLKEIGVDIEDMGAFFIEKEDDYPDVVFLVAKKVGESPDTNKGIVFGYSGQGEAIAANKVKGVRAAVYYGGERDIIRLSREDNASNVLSIGAGFVNKEEAIKAIKLWLETDFKGGRHERRIQKISDFEKAQ